MSAPRERKPQAGGSRASKTPANIQENDEVSSLISNYKPIIIKLTSSPSARRKAQKTRSQQEDPTRSPVHQSPRSIVVR
jgi:hypothetical protein